MEINITEYIEGMIADRVKEQEKIQKLQKRNYYLQQVLDGHGIKLVYSHHQKNQRLNHCSLKLIRMILIL